MSEFHPKAAFRTAKRLPRIQSRADVAKHGARRWYPIEIRKPCNTYLDGIRMLMIRSFKGKFAEPILQGRIVPKGFPANLAKLARRKLIMVDAAGFLEALSSPPGNRLERLKGDLAGKHSIRINDQWRIVFRWTDAGPEEVEIIDYH